VKVNDVRTFGEITRGALAANHIPVAHYVRAPVVEDHAPLPEALDAMVAALAGRRAADRCIFSCQLGRGRTTLG